MSATRPLVLAIADPGLRSLLAARLTLADELPIVCADHRNPAFGEPLRAMAILVIEESLIAAAPEAWAATLRDQCWHGPLIIIVDAMPDGVRSTERFALIDRRHAVQAVTALVLEWQARGIGLINRPE